MPQAAHPRRTSDYMTARGFAKVGLLRLPVVFLER